MWYYNHVSFNFQLLIKHQTYLSVILFRGGSSRLPLHELKVATSNLRSRISRLLTFSIKRSFPQIIRPNVDLQMTPIIVDAFTTIVNLPQQVFQSHYWATWDWVRYTNHSLPREISLLDQLLCYPGHLNVSGCHPYHRASYEKDCSVLQHSGTIQDQVKGIRENAFQTSLSGEALWCYQKWSLVRVPLRS